MRKTKISKLLALAMAAATVFALSACGGSGTPSSSAADQSAAPSESAAQTTDASADASTPAEKVKTIQDGKLIVAAEFTYPPFEYMADDGTTELGLDIDLAKAIGEKLGLEVEFVSTQFDGILDGLGLDKYDAVISAVTITPERKADVDFTQPYIENCQCLVTLASNDKAVSDVSELSDHSVGFQTGTTSNIFIDNKIKTGDLKNVTTNMYDKAMDAFSDLELGRIEYVICDSSVADIYVKNKPDVFKSVWTQSDSPEQFAIAVKKGNTQLLEAIDNALSEIMANGEFDAIRNEWLAQQ